MTLCVWLAVGGPVAARVTAGDWGGQHVRLVVAKDGAEIEFDCAHGRIAEALVLDDKGRFDAKGSLVAERGPVRKDAREEGRPARFRGTLAGGTLSLSVSLDADETLGPFTLTHGGRARLVKCK